MREQVERPVCVICGGTGRNPSNSGESCDMCLGTGKILEWKRVKLDDQPDDVEACSGDNEKRGTGHDPTPPVA